MSTLVALSTGSAITGIFQPVLDITPVLRVRADSQAGPSTVATQADIPFRVAGLACRQVLAGLAGMG